MLINLIRIHCAEVPRRPEESKAGQQKAGTIAGSGPLCWLVARINLFNSTTSAQILETLCYALLLGLTVRSRTCVRMLDICIPLSCETKGKSSAIN